MKTIKPLALSVLHRVVEQGGAFQLCVAAVAYVTLGDDAALLTELALWKEAAALLGGVVDEVAPKARAEVLVTGSAHAPGGSPAPAVDVRVRIGAVDKTLRVTGDRRWTSDDVPSAPEPFTEMPLTWARSFGGEGFAPNPLGKGFAPDASVEGAPRPLPNVEDPRAMVRGPNDRPAPAGLGPIDPTWPQRAGRMGTFDERWLREDFPGLPRDLDCSAFNAAPDDQRIEGRWRGDEGFALDHLHPTRARVDGRLPGFAARVFVNARAPDGEALREVPVALDTVHFLPGAERAVLVYRGVTPVAEDDASDVLQLLAALERVGAPKDAEHYRAVLAQRMDPQKGARFAFRERDLLPEGVSSGLAELFAQSPGAPQGLLADNQRRRAEAELERARENLRARGVDPDPHLPARFPEPEPPPSLDELPEALERAESFAEAQRAGADTARQKAESDARRLCARNGVDYDALLARRRAEDAGPPRFSAKAERERLTGLAARARAAGVDAAPLEARLADPGLQEKLERAEAALLEAYRATAHHRDAAPRLADALNARARRFVEDRRARGEGLAAWDFTGADLSGMDLSGMDLRRSLMESVNLRGCTLSDCDFTGAVLAHADLSGATLDGAKLAGANLGGAVLRGAMAGRPVDLTGATLWKTDLGGASFAGASLDGTQVFEATLRDATLGALSAVDATFYQCDLSGLSLDGAHLAKATFLECSLVGAGVAGVRLREAALIGCDLSGADLQRAGMEGLRAIRGCLFVGADLREARLPHASLREAKLAGARLAGATLTECDLSGCDLRGADLTEVSAAKVRLTRADLTGATLARARLPHALLRNATVEDADFTRANLFGADMTRAKGRARSLDDANLGRVVAPRRQP
jgi:uncharacterized protein YjbI with pentapeptide repeats